MLKRVRDGWEMFISILALLASIAILLLTYHTQERIREENKALKHHLSQICEYIDALPNKHRAVFEVCLENLERR